LEIGATVDLMEPAGQNVLATDKNSFQLSAFQLLSQPLPR
jgi:hypothetical protein